MLDGANAGRVMTIYPRNGFTNTIAIRHLTFANGNAHEEFQSVGGGLLIGGSAIWGKLVIEHNLFLNNKAEYDGGLSLYTDANGHAGVSLTNNVFQLNQGGAATMSVSNAGILLSGARMLVLNNTVVGNQG